MSNTSVFSVLFVSLSTGFQKEHLKPDFKGIKVCGTCGCVVTDVVCDALWMNVSCGLVCEVGCDDSCEGFLVKHIEMNI